MDPRCRVEMLGPLRLIHGEQTLTRFGTQKAAALLAFLAVRPGPHPREGIIDAFWPDMDLPAGRNNLNTALSALRHVLEPPGVRKGAVLVTNHSHVGLEPAVVTTDTGDFERLLAQAARSECAPARAELRGRALALYAGDFQPGNYQDWAVRESERLQARRVEAWERQGDDLEATGRDAEAADASRRRLDADPYDETAHVALVRRLVRAGQSGAAREAADRFGRFFREEFGAPPSPASQRAVAELLPRTDHAPETGRRPAAPQRAPARPSPEAVAAGSGLPPPAGVKPPEAPPPLLPFWLSRFFGRESEMSRLAGLLLSQKDVLAGPDLPSLPCRLVTLLGPGGTGKTRLAAQFARHAAERHGFFCVFVPLADLTTPEQVLAQIAQSLRLPPAPGVTPGDQIAGFFQERDRPGAPPALMLLDNLEHLLETEKEDAARVPGRAVAQTVQALLRDAPGLAVLATSRRRLGLQGERVLPLDPLPVPDASEEGDGGPDALAALLDVPSVRLYVDRAQAVRPDFGLTTVNAPAVAALCRALEGSPLALELAASWVRLLPPRKMWERLSQGLEMPEGRHADLPDRHRSLEAALDWSWRLLTERQRRLLAHVAVFRGGWTARAAEIVCEEPNALELLADLQEASLVTVAEGADGESRYSLLETIRQSALGRLRESGGEAEARARHLAWSIAQAEASEPELFGARQKEWLERLEAEHDNLRAALDWSASQPGSAEDGLRLAGALGKFWTVRGHLAEARARLRTALARAEDAGPDVRSKALYEAGALANAQGDHQEARRFLEECLSVRRAGGDRTGCAGPLRMLGIGARERGEYDDARSLLTESLSLYREAGDRVGEVGAITSLGNVAWAVGDPETAQSLYVQSLPLYRANGDRRGVAVALGNLGNVAGARGEYAEAQRLLAECLDIYAELGDIRGCAITRQSQTVTAFKAGDDAAATRLVYECLTLYQNLGDRQGGLPPLEALAAILTRTGRSAPAARLWAAADALRRGIGAAQLEDHAEEIERVRAALGGDAFADAWAFGRAMSWEQAVEYALQDHGPEKDQS